MTVLYLIGIYGKFAMFKLPNNIFNICFRITFDGLRIFAL